VLILPPGHGHAISARRTLTIREKWMIRGVLAVVVAVGIALVISFATAGNSSGHGCIYATIAGDVGAQEIHECGKTARQTCATVHAAYPAQSAATIAAECRKAGLPVG
jgi:uncharacterized protein YcfJ